MAWGLGLGGSSLSAGGRAVRGAAGRCPAAPAPAPGRCADEEDHQRASHDGGFREDSRDGEHTPPAGAGPAPEGRALGVQQHSMTWAEGFTPDSAVRNRHLFLSAGGAIAGRRPPRGAHHDRTGPPSAAGDLLMSDKTPGPAAPGPREIRSGLDFGPAIADESRRTRGKQGRGVDAWNQGESGPGARWPRGVGAVGGGVSTRRAADGDGGRAVPASLSRTSGQGPVRVRFPGVAQWHFIPRAEGLPIKEPPPKRGAGVRPAPRGAASGSQGTTIMVSEAIPRAGAGRGSLRDPEPYS
jgi:hypothetical protein